MLKRIVLVILGVLALVAVLAFLKFLQIKKMIESAPKPGAQTVTSTSAQMQEWQPQLSAVGSVTPFRGVDVTTEVSGLVREVGFKSGQDVKKGQVLIQLNADADIAQLHALEAAAELSDTTLKRDQAQFAAQAISQAQLDADAADLKAKRAQVAQQRANVEKKTIRAPFAGRLGITAVNPGQYLNPGDKIVTLQTIDTVYVDFFLPQKNLSSLKVGQHVVAVNDAFPGVQFTGQLSSINPKVDTATRNVQLQATFANGKGQLMPGMFSSVSVDIGSKQQYLTLPQTAVTYNPYGATVFVVSESKDKDDKGKTQLEVQQAFITTGPTRGDQVAILKGLKAGDQVVTSGQIKLKNGTHVVIDNTVQPANNPNPTPQEK